MCSLNVFQCTLLHISLTALMFLLEKAEQEGSGYYIMVPNHAYAYV